MCVQVWLCAHRCVCVSHKEISYTELGHETVEAGRHLNVNLIQKHSPRNTQDNV